jgi:hypothetical protein
VSSWSSFTASRDIDRRFSDVKFNNILMDSSPLYDQPMHPVKSDRTYDWKRRVKPKRRTRRPVRYYYIDFDLCEQYDPAVGKAHKVPGYGGDRTPPEFKHPERLCDPFAVDVYRLGNILRSRIVGVCDFLVHCEA